MNAELAELREKHYQLIAERDRLASRVQALEEALRPLAKMADAMSASAQDEWPFYARTTAEEDTLLTVGDCRKAKAALTAQPDAKTWAAKAHKKGV